MAPGWHGYGQVVHSAGDQSGSRCAQQRAQPAEASLLYHEQPEPRPLLIGAFASNPAAFHAEDGSGYQFMVEMLTELNSRNPQVASRLIEPLIRLKRYDAQRRAKMRAALEQLKGLENLSGDLYERFRRRWRNINVNPTLSLWERGGVSIRH